MADKTGYLIKEGGNFKTWKKRWMVLKNNVIYYSKDQNSGELGIIRLNGLKPENIQINSSKKKKNCFQIETPSRTYYLVADTEEEREIWMSACKSSVQPIGKGGNENKPIGLGDFDLLKVIGKGSFGRVLQVRKKDNGKIYAMKVLNKKNILENQELDHTRTEKNILQKLAHPFLVNLNYSFQTNYKLFFVMDFVNGGELFYHLQKDQKFTAERVKFYCAEIVLGIEYLHNSGVIYRDLKPENILLTADGHICMTDFGISKEGLIAQDATTKTFCGTPEYLAPEVLQNVGYTKAVDWWSFGTLMYEMLTGLPPFYSTEVQQMYFKIMHAKLELPETLTEDTKSILTGLLQRDPEKRLTNPAQIKSHPYFNDIDWEALLKKEIKPPFIPPVKSKEDTSMIDVTFLSEKVLEDEVPANLSEGDQMKFEGFTYAPSEVEGILEKKA